MRTVFNEQNKSFSYLANGVSERDEAWLELLRRQSPRPALVEVVEGGAELVELLLCNALAVASQDLSANVRSLRKIQFSSIQFRA